MEVLITGVLVAASGIMRLVWPRPRRALSYSVLWVQLLQWPLRVREEAGSASLAEPRGPHSSLQGP